MIDIIKKLKTERCEDMGFVSIYISGKMRKENIFARIISEHNKASNIKSNITRNNVQRTLECIMSRLTYIDEIPFDGMIFYSGINVVGNLLCYNVIPTKPVMSYRYYCNSTFHIDNTLVN